MDCSAITETLVACAREGREPQSEIRAHLLVCDLCTDRWEAEFLLSSQFQALRAQTGGRRSAYIRRAEALKRFDTLHPKRTVRPWWGLAAAAALLMTLGAGMALRHTSPALMPFSDEISAAQSDAQEAGFIAVPFVPPLAPGELVRVVHTELQPAELASLGVNVDPTLSADLPADVLVGADGFPRAVRISDEVSGVAGY